MTLSRCRRGVAAGALAAGLLLSSAVPASAHPIDYTTPASAPVPAWLGHCTDQSVTTTLATGQRARVAGTLCRPRGHVRTVLVLVHGATYNSSYWDWPLDPARQSFVWAALRAGYATFAIDKLGAGRSDAPASSLVTFTAQADAIHQAVQVMRDRFSHVVIIGHSFGTAEADAEFAADADADALVATGSGHALSTVTAQESVIDFAPGASLVPRRFAGRDAGYVTTTTVAARRALLYNATTADGIVTFDAATRDVFSQSELTTRPANLGGLTRSITAPVLLIDGSLDTHYCNGATPEFDLDDCASAVGLYASEQANYGPCFAASVVPGSGHDLTTESGAPVAAATILAYLARTVPADGAPVRCAIAGPLTPVAARP